MVSCHQCSTQNSLDSTFCKRCGTALAEDDLLRAQEKLAAWIAEGNIAFGEGRIEEALAIATAALESHANSVDALILKSLCYERLGNISEALAYAEKVVDLNPDSELDKIRRNGLRTALGNVLMIPDSSDRRGSMLAAVAAVVMVLSLGALAVHFYESSPKVVAENTPSKGFGTAVTFPTNSAVTTTPTTTSPPSTTPPATATSTPNQPTDSGDAQPIQRPPFERVNTNGTLPIAPPVSGALGLQPDGIANPVSPLSAQHPSGISDPAPSQDPAPVAEGPSSNPTASTPPDDDPGTIQISVHRGSGNRNLIRGSQPVGDSGTLSSNGVEALARTGYQQYMVGSFGAAATSFEKALHGGGDPIRLNQRLGQVYSKLGRTSDAISAYSKAVAACQQALQAGKGDKASVQATLEACQQASKVLGG